MSSNLILTLTTLIEYADRHKVFSVALEPQALLKVTRSARGTVELCNALEADDFAAFSLVLRDNGRSGRTINLCDNLSYISDVLGNMAVPWVIAELGIGSHIDPIAPEHLEEEHLSRSLNPIYPMLAAIIKVPADTTLRAY